MPAITVNPRTYILLKYDILLSGNKSKYPELPGIDSNVNVIFALESYERDWLIQNGPKAKLIELNWIELLPFDEKNLKEIIKNSVKIWNAEMRRWWYSDDVKE